MRILVAHNRYLKLGGEDTVFRSEVALLRQYGHDVVEYIDFNQRISEMNPSSVVLQTIWSQPSYHSIKKLVRKVRPDIVHFHNIFPLISPSAYYACHDMNVPIVQSLHNPRLICPAATFFRDGHLCTDCLGKTPPWPAILHACYRHSRSHSTVVVSMLTVHRWLRTWKRMVSGYIVFTDFYREIFASGGLPADKLYVKPHFVSGSFRAEDDRPSKSYALFVGRLDEEKGIWTLLEAWSKLAIPLKIRGNGKLEQAARQFVQDKGLKQIDFIHPLPKAELDTLIRGARFLIIPSQGYYETFSLVAIESYAQGTPVLASRIGALSEIVADGKTGLHFNPGDPQDLGLKAQWLWDRSEETRRLGQEAYKEYEHKYTPERNYPILMDIYAKVREAKN